MHEDQKHDKAFTKYQEIANEGNEKEKQIANFNLGFCFLFGVGAPGGPNEDEAFKY